jgi:hypothetical protein
MKLTTFSLLSLLALSIAPLGCAMDAASPEEGDAEEVGAIEDELSASAFRGNYMWLADVSGDFTDFEQLSLNSGGNYTAQVQAPPHIMCIAFPCTVPEAGKWSVYKVSGQQKIRFKPNGKPARIYGAWYSFPQKSLRLTRFGKSTKLFKEPLLTCASVLCAPNTTCTMKLVGNGPPQAVCEPVAAPCVKTGCSGHICADEDMFTTCEWHESYACYATATCERQPGGECGWTETTELTNCLEGSR